MFDTFGIKSCPQGAPREWLLYGCKLVRAGGTKLFHSAPKEVDFPPTLPLRKNADMRTHSHKLKGKICLRKLVHSVSRDKPLNSKEK